MRGGRWGIVVGGLLVAGCSAKEPAAPATFRTEVAAERVTAACTDRCGCERVCFTFVSNEGKPDARCDADLARCEASKQPSDAPVPEAMTEISACRPVSTVTKVPLADALGMAQLAADRACGCQDAACAEAARQGLADARTGGECTGGEVARTPIEDALERGSLCVAALVANPYVVAVEELAAKACACADAACARRAHQELMVFVEDNQDVKGTVAERRAIRTAADRLAECVANRPSGASE